MTVVAVIVCAAVGAAVVAGTVAWFLPNFDPAAPRPPVRAIRKEVVTRPRLARFLRSRADPATLTGLALTVALGLVLAGGAAVGALFVMAQHHALLAHYDLSAARWGGSHATSWSTRVSSDVSFVAATPSMIVIATVAAVWEYRRSRRPAVLAFMATVAVGQLVVSNLVKVLVDRPRPDIAPLTHFAGSSFPSGHATTAAAVFAAVAFLLGRRRSQRTKAFLAAGAAAVAAAVATSRVLLGVHWFTDVLAGLALGWAWFAVTAIAFGGRVLRFGRPVEIAERVAETTGANSTTARGSDGPERLVPHRGGTRERGDAARSASR
jgi:membrane-associated phospholipid phosphatase